MILQIQNKQRKFSVDGFHELVETAVQKTLENEKIDAFITENHIEPGFSITFVNNSGMRTLNRDYRGIDKTTDVLSFPLIDSNGRIISKVSKKEIFLNKDGIKELYFGDIVLSIEKITEQALTLGHSVERELCFLTVHSVLHLLGYDHMDLAGEKRMIKQQREIMNKLNIEQ